jgi:pyridoxamine 5'-phosphate oxidase
VEPAADPARAADLRRNYERAGLDESALAPDPVSQFRAWFHDAVSARVVEPNAMIVATASAAGAPSARTVLLKGYDERGFVFFTNLGSRKARELAENPRASLVFPWYAIERQVVVVGVVEPAGSRPRLTSTPGHAGRNWVRGPARSRRSSPRGRCSSRDTRRSRGAGRTRR